MCVVAYKICFKAIHHLQGNKNLQFLLTPLILRLHTKYRLDWTLGKCIAGFQKVKMLKCFDRTAIHFHNFTVEARS